MAITTYNEVRSAFLSRSAGDLNERHQRARSYIDEANLFRGWKRAEEVPVSLDPLPFVLEHGEITDLQRDLTAWAESLAATYRDLWDAQTLVDAGVLPSSTLWGEARFDPGFARCLPSASPPLYVLGFTLERSPSGWRGHPGRQRATVRSRVRPGRPNRARPLLLLRTFTRTTSFGSLRFSPE
jgi:uncharacterized circularly permuted ATP-grasp superfamily protein